MFYVPVKRDFTILPVRQTETTCIAHKNFEEFLNEIKNFYIEHNTKILLQKCSLGLRWWGRGRINDISWSYAYESATFCFQFKVSNNSSVFVFF